MTAENGTCPIWETEAVVCCNEFKILVSSDRAGGAYYIMREAERSIFGKDQEYKARLTSWLVDQRLQGVEKPLITRDTITFIDSKQQLPVYERAERLLQFIAGQAKTVARIVSIQQETNTAAYAWSESIEWREVAYFLDYLQEMNWIKGQRSGEGWFFGVPTVDGYRRIADQKININSSQSFVAMWFDESMNQAFEYGIRPAIENAGYKPLRIDQKPDLNKIDDEIIAEIRRSKFLVADFTHGDNGARGGVYFEAGYAQGLGIPVIYTCRQDMVDKLHFDTRQYAHIVWSTPEELRDCLLNRIRARIGAGPESTVLP